MQVTIELWAVVNELGEYAVGASQEDAESNYADQIGDNLARRVVCWCTLVDCPETVVVYDVTPPCPEGASSITN